MNVFFDLILDFKHFVTLIQRSFEVKNLKATFQIVNFLLKNIDKEYFKLALKRDLPQILSSQKFNIKNLVNITENLESWFLPNLGEKIIKYKYIKNFDSYFFCEDLIINDILKQN